MFWCTHKVFTGKLEYSSIIYVNGLSSGITVFNGSGNFFHFNTALPLHFAVFNGERCTEGRTAGGFDEHCDGDECLDGRCVGNGGFDGHECSDSGSIDEDGHLKVGFVGEGSDGDGGFEDFTDDSI